jgi:Flp pilus assembly protein TadD
MLTLRPLRLALLIGLAAAFTADAQRGSSPPRPRLAKGVDAKDWRSYYKCGLSSETQAHAHACFHWASRLDPAQPEPYYADWLVSGAKKDSLLELALERDPFIHDSRVVVIAEPQYGIFSKSKDKGWNALRAGNYFRASTELAKAIALDTSAIDERYGLAVAYYYRTKFDSAAMTLQPLMRMLRARQEKRVDRAYHSLDFIEYMAAVAWRSAGRPDSVRAALTRALTENLARYRAHAMLGELARAEGDSATAEQEWSLAAELGPADLSFRLEYAQFLLSIGRFDQAEQELRRIVTANPDYVDAQYYLAIALDKLGRNADAIAQYRAYIELAPTVLARNIAMVRERIDKLSQ